MIRDVIHPINVMFLGSRVYEVVKEMSLTVLIFSEVLHQHRTCFSRPRMMFWGVAWVIEYLSNQLVVAANSAR